MLPVRDHWRAVTSSLCGRNKRPEWRESLRLEASPFEDMLLNYDAREDGELAHYVADEHGGEQFEQLAAELDRTDALAEKDERIAELEAQLRETPTPATARADGGENRSIEEQTAAIVRELERGD